MQNSFLQQPNFYALSIPIQGEDVQLREAVGASKSTFAKLGKNENVTLPVLLNICEYLECDFGDIMEAVPENEV